MERRTFVRGGIASTLALVGTMPLRATAPDPYRLDLVHPQLRPAAGKIVEFSGSMPPLTPATLSAWRNRPSFAQPPRDDVPHEARQIPGPGDTALTIYIVNGGVAGPARPCIVHTHGGGFVMGSARDSVRMLQDLCADLGCMAVSVEYRLAPEATWRASLADNYAALAWVHADAAALGVDRDRIAVMGESAGGGHAALLAIAARDRAEVPLAFQCLTYPMLDDRTGSTRDPAPFVGKLIWTPESNRFGWRAFLGTAPGGPAVPAAAVPARTTNFAGLPPAFIGVGSIDLFADEDTEYARALNAAGVASELIVVPGAFHGFDVIGTTTPIGRWFDAARRTALRQGLGLQA
jgi:acetyl esterase/lipase